MAYWHLTDFFNFCWSSNIIPIIISLLAWQQDLQLRVAKEYLKIVSDLSRRVDSSIILALFVARVAYF